MMFMVEDIYNTYNMIFSWFGMVCPITHKDRESVGAPTDILFGRATFTLRFLFLHAHLQLIH